MKREEILTDTVPEIVEIKIEDVISKLNKMKNKGATHLEFDYSGKMECIYVSYLKLTTND